MDPLSLLRTMGGLGVVLGLLWGALWVVRRYDIALPGRVGGKAPDRRVSVIERVQLDAKRSLVLLRRDDREHLFVLLPDRVAILETDIVRAASDAAARKRDMVLCPNLDGEWYA